MELSTYQTNSSFEVFNCWQHFCEGIVKSVIHTIKHSFDLKEKASIRELIIFFIFGWLIQFILIPTETYTTLRASIGMYTASFLTDLLVFIIPFISLCIRFFK